MVIPPRTSPLPGHALTIGIDLGGTNVLAVATEGGRVVGRTKEKTPVHGGPLAVVDALAGVTNRLTGGAVPAAVGVGAPGAIDHAEGVIRWAPNLPGWLEPFELGPALSAMVGDCPVHLDNDVNVGTMAEAAVGAGQGQADLVGLFVGTGVGAGLVLDGTLRRGPTGFAGEIGHVVVRPGGRRCGCGGRGHVEAYAGRASMERRARQLSSRGTDTLLVELAKARRMTSSVFARALAARDPVAIGLVDGAVEALGVAVATAAVLLDIPLVVIGGGLSDRLGPEFVARIEKAALELMPGGQAEQLRVVPSALRDRGGAIGAALLAGATLSPEETAADQRP